MTGIARRKNDPQSRLKTSPAVMAQRAPKEVEADDPQRKLWRQLDYYATPPWGSRAGAELVRSIAPDTHLVWEPACGDGIMAECLSEYFPNVLASDIHDHGYRRAVKSDFLLDSETGNWPHEARVDWVITNPPFALADQFLARALEVSRIGVAFLLRLAFLESEPRYKPLYVGPNRLTLCAPFIERLPMQLGPWKPRADDGKKSSSATCYAWFIFLKGAAPVPIQPIPPGTRDRLWKPDDVRRFVPKKHAPLLDHPLRTTAESESVQPAAPS